ncbi:hypothetical protein [Mycobacteroides chelonae]|jgi:hypothetical protein|uniref:Uncharacterized protein n=1 Tax=Mycobacteroides chelonae TaxID=1774 RepID=A0AB73TYY6_MYCCH|nr:hypothetical protein [Mycobacteroides chelonae]MBF9316839.1 hypothetical protein [Mycobacteroides chelonae]MBF9328179.1 hypothetical protein [Mycobacteroides chelonae]MBF9422357.1 hypothetical protein [Mycobacteroides chelonae]MBF9435495.1 hypothetical protein [Mycobacteroides chelonae]MBV6362231.1 hypothetical protein [Mycobacteroides chelonae]
MTEFPPDEESMPPTTQRPLNPPAAAYSEADDSEISVGNRSWRWVWIVCAAAALAIVAALVLALLEVDKAEEPVAPAPVTTTTEHPRVPSSSVPVAPPTETVVTTVIETTVVVETPAPVAPTEVTPTEVVPTRPEEGRLCHELHPRRDCDGYR